MGQSARQALAGIWATITTRLRARARERGGVGLADNARRASDWDLAILNYENYLRCAPRDLGIRLRLIKTLYAAGRLGAAEVEIRAAIADRPDKTELAAMLADILAARQASIPVEDYDRFRRGLVIPPARGSQDAAPLAVRALIDGRDKTTQDIQLTLDSLRRSVAPVEAVVVWSGDEGGGGLSPSGGAVLALDAGVILDPEALGWLSHAAGLTGAVAVYGDDDFKSGMGAADAFWSAPAFHAAPHPLDLATTPRLAPAVLFSGKGVDLATLDDRRRQMMAAFEIGPVAHVPLLLATRTSEPAVQHPFPRAERGAAASNRILAVIPTREEGAVLIRMIDSLMDTAARSDLLEIIVVDNGSREPETLERLEGLARDGRVKILRVDEPFNWSRLNNLAVASEGGGFADDILLFANNDMNMMTSDWDDQLRASLALEGVGVVGARLIYPNGRVQHAGMALGALDGRPVHEGLGAAASDEGPLGRWRRTRPAAAVTGAFMAVRREVFEAVNGFNAEAFAVGCNDIDFCLKARARGWTVLYAAELELVHWESHSRGHDDTEPKMRRAQAELAALEQLWGPKACRDTSRNPHWVNHQTLLFHGLRQPDEVVISSWIVESARVWRSPEGSGA